MNVQKALYIGPKGGKWADPQHTIPYDPQKHGSTQAPPEYFSITESAAAQAKFLENHQKLVDAGEASPIPDTKVPYVFEDKRVLLLAYRSRPDLLTTLSEKESKLVRSVLGQALSTIQRRTNLDKTEALAEEYNAKNPPVQNQPPSPEVQAALKAELEAMTPEEALAEYEGLKKIAGKHAPQSDVRNNLDLMTPKQRALLRALAAFTGANVRTCRDPSLFDESRATEPPEFAHNFLLEGEEMRGSASGETEIHPARLFFVANRFDYEVANRFLSKLSQAPLKGDDNTLWRGTRLSPEAVQKLAPGETITTRNITSFSAYPRTAFQFATRPQHEGDARQAVVFVERGAKQGGDISDLSSYSHEAEVLSGGSFRVVKVLGDKESEFAGIGAIQIEVERVP